MGVLSGATAAEKKTRRGSVPFRERLEKLDKQIAESKKWTAELQRRRVEAVNERAAQIRAMQDELGPTGAVTREDA